MSDTTILIAGLPRPSPAITVAVNPPGTPLLNIDEVAAHYHRYGYCLWLRFDGEEFVADLLCGVEHMPANLPRPHGRGVTARQAIEAADLERVKMEGKR